MAIIEITGNVQSRFIQAAVLLHLLDPVRGEPTTHGLDRDLNEFELNRERLLKRKFLDSFALICATKKDGDTVSAASLEEGLPEGTVIRVASNHGVTKATLCGLQELVSILNAVASGECIASHKESEVPARIISLDIARIRYYLKELRSVSDNVKEAIGRFKSGTAYLQTDHSRSVNFTEWIAHVFEIRDLAPDLAPNSCILYQGPGVPSMGLPILKLGRYAVASMALLRLASEFPSLFSPMLVEPAIAPQKVQFTITKQEMPLTSVLRRLVTSSQVDDYISRLARVWGVVDAEVHFREACALSLSVHAEMQLLNFYDHNPGRRPAFRFIGVSKKSCFLCQRFLVNHPQAFGVSSCHQKLYLPWRPPPAANATIYRQYKSITTDLSKDMEAAAKQELQNRLGLRRPVPPDSTAGVSLSGLSGEFVVGETLYATSSLSPIDVVDLTSPDEELSQSSFNISPVGDAFSIAKMVFHVMRPGETQRQDIIAIRDILLGEN
ncbi:hypothetical protein NA57DRAFT_81643 [Rhizodiscina lignyota]|uniref:Uncharacterized protein n=1 Tax=Rhizodiscina lignyota TaxID=1504668 RepID=A0A9P4M068_9PEZI|nr:hypothetical protein NA57DRAFT_81643 [Rhizodiscina lignyota]